MHKEKVDKAIEADELGAIQPDNVLIDAVLAFKALKGMVSVLKGLSGLADDAIKFGPMNKGPLPNSVANTFRSGTYSEMVSDGKLVLYRVYGGNAGKLGPYWTKTPPSGPVQSIIDSALNPQWGNTATNVVKIQVPKGVTYYEGAAGAQGGLVGGGSQVYFNNIRIDPNWIKP